MNIKKLLEKYNLSDKYEEYMEFSDGLAAVKRNGLWGFINEEGIEVITCKFDTVLKGFKNGVAIVSYHSGPPYKIDKMGRVEGKHWPATSFNETFTLNEWVKSQDTFSNMTTTVPGADDIGNISADEEWLNSIYETTTPDIPLEEKLNQLVGLWQEITMYPTILEIAKESSELKTIFQFINYKLPSGYQLNLSKSFASKCREFLKELYQMGIEDEEDLQRAIKLIRAMSGIRILSGLNDMRKNKEVQTRIFNDVLSDVSTCAKNLAAGKQFIKDEFSAPVY